LFSHKVFGVAVGKSKGREEDKKGKSHLGRRNEEGFECENAGVYYLKIKLRVGNN